MPSRGVLFCNPSCFKTKINSFFFSGNGKARVFVASSFSLSMGVDFWARMNTVVTDVMQSAHVKDKDSPKPIILRK